MQKSSKTTQNYKWSLPRVYEQSPRHSVTPADQNWLDFSFTLMVATTFSSEAVAQIDSGDGLRQKPFVNLGENATGGNEIQQENSSPVLGFLL